MSNVDLYERTYKKHVEDLKAKLAGDVGLQQAVGGSFIAVGQLERALLLQLGLQPDHFVADIGCGSGRLACQLASMPGLGYLGTDVVPELLQHAKRLSNRSDWSFQEARGLTIPVKENTADFVCFFSVFTHLRHEDTYRYLREAKRILKPSGKIVFSFLEFYIPSHWAMFDGMIKREDPGYHVDQFMDRDGIRAFAQYLDLEVEAIYDGDKPHIPFDGVITWDDGRTMTGQGALGQSVAVLKHR